MITVIVSSSGITFDVISVTYQSFLFLYDLAIEAEIIYKKGNWFKS